MFLSHSASILVIFIGINGKMTKIAGNQTYSSRVCDVFSRCLLDSPFTLPILIILLFLAYFFRCNIILNIAGCLQRLHEADPDGVEWISRLSMKM